MTLSAGEFISPQTAYYRRLTPEQKAAQVERNRARKAARSPEQIEADRLKANAAHAAWKARNPERMKTLRRKADAKRYSDPEKRRVAVYTKVKHRARQVGREFTLTLEDIVIPKKCPVLGIPLEFSINKGRKAQAAFNSPSIDRVDSTKGYVKDNIRIISNRANLLKGTATLHEMERICAYMRGEL